jgi:ribosomal protein L9
MRVLLRDDIAGVGKRGDIVEVAKGFARNYLLPTGRALVAGDRIAQQAVAMRRIKTVGTHVVPVTLHDEVEAEVTVEVVASS